MPESNVYGGWPTSGEVDIIESRGNDPSYKAGGNNVFSSIIHLGPKWNADMWSYTHQEHTDTNNTLTGEWHIYGLKWTSTGMYTYLDGIKGFAAVLGICLQTEVLFETLIIISFRIELYIIKLT
jgi:hypothetical protein